MCIVKTDHYYFFFPNEKKVKMFFFSLYQGLSVEPDLYLVSNYKLKSDKALFLNFH